MTIDAATLAGYIAEYGEAQPRFTKYTEVLERELKKACEWTAPRAVVQSRVKSISSFVEKVVRREGRYENPVCDFCDLAGARVIGFTQTEVDSLCQYIVGHFVILETEDMKGRLGEREFGYRAVHYTVEVDEQCGLGLSAEELTTIGGLKAEIQVRTVLQHAWADVLHDRLYKTDITVPRELRREAGRLAAHMEEGDEAIGQFIDRIDAYRLHYSAYMDAEQLESEIEMLLMIQENEPEAANKPRVALRLAEVASSAGRWKLVISEVARYVSVASPVQDELNVAYGAALCKDWEDEPQSPKFRKGQRVLTGVAKCRQYADEDSEGEAQGSESGKGQTYGGGLGKWADGADRCLSCDERSPVRAKALAWLGWSELKLRGGDYLGYARTLYYRACQCNPSDPYSLAHFLECEALDSRNMEFAGLSFPQIANAIAKCEEHIRVRIQVPEAFWALATLKMLAGRSREGLLALCRGVVSSNTEEPIEEELERVVGLQERVAELRKPLEPARQVLVLGVVGKLYSVLAAKQKARDEAKKRHDNSPKEESGGKVSAEDLQKAYVKADADVAAAKQKLKDRLGRVFGPGSEGVKRSAGDPRVLVWNTKARAVLQEHIKDEVRLAIIAGGADPRLDKRLEDYQSLLRDALRGLDGIVFSGGTPSGIPGLLGAIADEQRRAGKKRFELYSYLPSMARLEVEKDTRYDELFSTRGEDFSCREPLQNWIDLMSLGVNPGDVRILGINGGEIAEFEYHLGLALGATVALVEGSGRKAAEMLAEEPWTQRRQLIRLPHDGMSARAFLFSAGGAKEDLAYEKAARKAHEDYQVFSRPKEPSLSAWEALDEDLKRSCYYQVMYAQNILERGGLRLRRLKKGRKAAESLEDLLGDDADVRIREMAEMEHGRWTVERLMQGWIHGKTKDVGKKTSPYLVPWKDVPPDIQQYDIEAVTNMPKYLKEAGWEVYKA